MRSVLLILALFLLAACGGATAAPEPTTAPPAPPAAALPRIPSRDDVMASLSRVVPAIRSCGQLGTTVRTHFVFRGSDGGVVSVDVPPETPAASCITEAASHAQLPPFSQAQFEVWFPFSL